MTGIKPLFPLVQGNPMIKLILNPDEGGPSASFGKTRITIGSQQQNDPPGSVDYVLETGVPDSLLLDIYEEGEGFSLASHDPSTEVCINGQPTEYGSIQPGDLIGIGPLVIEFQHVTEDAPDEDADFNMETELQQLSELFDDEEEQLSDDSVSFDLSDKEIEEFLEEVDALDLEEEITEDEPEPEDVVPPQLVEQQVHQGISIQEESPDAELTALIDKSTPLHDASEESLSPIDPAVDEEETDLLAKQGHEQESDDWKLTPRHANTIEESIADLNLESEAGFADSSLYIDNDLPSSHRRRRRQILLMATAALLLIVSSAMISVFILRGQNTQKELVAARGVCDISVALIHARANGSIPYNNDPMDPDFLEENLISVLTPQYRLLSHVHTENATLSEDSYKLHILARTDLSKFIVIALPLPGPRQTLAPLPSIILYSDEMTVTRSFHTKHWQTFIDSTHSLGEVPTENLKALMRGSENIRLSTLDDQKKTLGFTLPSELGHLLEEATTKVYNAPRYFSLTEPLVELIPSAVQGTLTTREKTAFRQAFQHLTTLPFLIMYSSKEGVERAKHALDTGILSRNPVLGMVHVDPHSELITSTEIFLDEDSDAIGHYIEAQHELQQALPSLTTLNVEDNSDVIRELTVIDHNHPLLITLSDEANHRQEALTNVAKRIDLLLEEHNRRQVPDLSEKLKRLSGEYVRLSEEYEHKIATVLRRYYLEHVGEGKVYTLNTFLAAVKAADLESLLPESIQTEAIPPSSGVPLNEESKQFQSLIEALRESNDLTQLHELVEEGAALIDSKRLTMADQAISQHATLRVEVLKKISDFLLAPKDIDTPQTFHEQNRSLLNNIFDLADISDLEEREYYLNEFDLLMERFRSISHQTLQELQDLDDKIARDLEDKDIDLSYRMELERQREAVREEKAHQRTEVMGLKEQLSRLPIVTTTTSAQEQTQNLARLGQQVLIQASLNEPSNTRDEKLLEAVALLTESTNENRSLWEDILEARRLITETPKENILNILRSDLGFSPSKQPMSATIRNQIGQYIAAQQALIQTQDMEHYEALFEAFSDRYRENLMEVVNTTEKMSEYSNRLIGSMDQYIERLKDFRDDYARAKEEGFFHSNRRYHNIMSQRLDRKVLMAQELRSAVNDVCRELISSGEAHKTLCENELMKIETKKRVTPDSAAQLIRDSNSISYPNLMTDSLNDQIMDLLDIGVYPISQ